MGLVRKTAALVAALSVLACLMLASRPAFAFPWMIREGYTGCNTCHADPSGAGILTQYGRGMEEVILRMPYKKDADPGKTGNFFFGAFDLPDQLLLQTDARNLVMTVIPNGSPAQLYDYVMQLDQSAQLKLGRFRMNGSIGYTPPTQEWGGGGALAASLTDQPSSWGAIVARQYWLGLDIGKDEEFLLRAGRLNVPYGIRTLEHPFFVRSVTRTDSNTGQEHGVSLAYTGEKVRGEVMAILGNYAIRPDAFRERGGSAFVELTPSTKVAIGASALITHADVARSDLEPSLSASPIFRQDYALHARISPAKALVILAEVDALYNSQQLPGGGTSNHFGMASLLQVDLQLYQGIHLLAANEIYNGHIAEKNAYNTTTVTAWGGLWWFFAPHVDLRVDFVYATGSAPGSTPTSPGSALLAQIHGYL